MCAHVCVHKYAHECLTELWSMLSSGMMSCELLASVEICITRKRAWQAVWDSEGETPQWPLQWLVRTFIFYKPHDSLPPSTSLSLLYMNTHCISLNPQNNHNKHTQSMAEFRLHTRAYTIFPQTPALKQEKVPRPDSKQTNMKRFLAGLRESCIKATGMHNQQPIFSLREREREREYAQCCSRPELLVIRMGSEERQAVEWMQMNSLAPALGSTTSLFI